MIARFSVLFYSFRAFHCMFLSVFLVFLGYVLSSVSTAFCPFANILVGYSQKIDEREKYTFYNNIKDPNIVREQKAPDAAIYNTFQLT